MSEAEYIKAPNNLRKAKIGSGKGKLDPELLQRAEKVVKKIQSDYTEWADEDLGALEAALVDLQAGADDRDAIIKDLYRISLDIKGSGGSFGFLMMSEVAAAVMESSDPEDLRVIDEVFDALTRMFSEGGKRYYGDHIRRLELSA